MKYKRYDMHLQCDHAVLRKRCAPTTKGVNLREKKERRRYHAAPVMVLKHPGVDLADMLLFVQGLERHLESQLKVMQAEAGSEVN